MDNNFKCSQCQHEFYVPRYSIIIKHDKTKFLISGRDEEIQCPGCKSKDIRDIPKEIDLTNVMYGKFASADDAGKKSMLRKRVEQHKKKTEEQYNTIDREFKGKVNEKHY